eukprot:Rmarinus@m.11825
MVNQGWGWKIRIFLADLFRSIAMLLSEDSVSPLPQDAEIIQKDSSSDLVQRTFRGEASAIVDHALLNLNPLRKTREIISALSSSMTHERFTYVTGSWMCSTLLWLPYAYLLVATHALRCDKLGSSMQLLGIISMHDAGLLALIGAIILFWVVTGSGGMAREISVKVEGPQGVYEETTVQDASNPDPVFMVGVVGVAIISLTCIGYDAMALGMKIIGVAGFALALSRGLTYASAKAVNNEGMAHLAFLFSVVDWFAIILLSICSQNGAFHLFQQVVCICISIVVLSICYSMIDFYIVRDLAKLHQLHSAPTFARTIRVLLVLVAVGIIVLVAYLTGGGFARLLGVVVAIAQSWFGFGIGAAPHWLQITSRVRVKRTASARIRQRTPPGSPVSAGHRRQHSGSSAASASPQFSSPSDISTLRARPGQPSSFSSSFAEVNSAGTVGRNFNSPSHTVSSAPTLAQIAPTFRPVEED